MRVQMLNGLGEAYDLPATRILVTGDDGTPVMVASERSAGVISCAHANDGAEFHQLLRALGIDRTVIITTLKPKLAEDILAGGR